MCVLSSHVLHAINVLISSSAKPTRSDKESTISRNHDGPAMAMWAIRSFFYFVAFATALFPSVMKIYETSHWYREGDPSVYDNAKDWFSNPNLPFQSYIDNSKVRLQVASTDIVQWSISSHTICHIHAVTLRRCSCAYTTSSCHTSRLRFALQWPLLSPRPL